MGNKGAFGTTFQSTLIKVAVVRDGFSLESVGQGSTTRPAPDLRLRPPSKKAAPIDKLALPVAAAAKKGKQPPEILDDLEQGTTECAAGEVQQKREVSVAAPNSSKNHSAASRLDKEETQTTDCRAVLLRPPRRQGCDTELFVLSGVLCTTLASAPSGGVITAVRPFCTLGNLIHVGDMIVAITERRISQMQDLQLEKECSRVIWVAHWCVDDM